MKTPVVSVIMASYNHSDYVEKAIDSVLMQQGVEFEFLIADDGSKDDSREKIAAIKDPRIHFFPNTINRGACVVTNELISRAQGEFIALINSDDHWNNPAKLSCQLEILTKNPELGACFTQANFVDKWGTTLDKNQISFGSVFQKANRSQALWLRYFFDLGNCICHPTIMIRKKCYEELGSYNNRLRQLPDLDMWIRLVKKYSIYIHSQEWIDFRLLPGENASSQTSTNSIRTLNEHYLIAQQFFEQVSREQLIEGFNDCLVYNDIPSLIHLNIEKTLLYFQPNFSLERPYQIIGFQKMFDLLSDESYRMCLAKDYDIDELWFQQKMGQVDTLMRPQTVKTHSSSWKGFMKPLFSKQTAGIN